MNEDDLVVHIVDDDRAVRISLQRLLCTAGIKVRLYESAEAFLSAPNPKKLGTDCMLLDLALPGVSGVDLLERLHREGSALPVIVMTGLGDVMAAVRAMKAGALEYLEKPFTETALFAAISAAKGKSLANVPGPADPNIKEARARLATLSRREGQVLRGLARGDGQKLIAYDLGISVRTVEVHRARMLHRLGVRNVAQAISLSAIADLRCYDLDPPKAAYQKGPASSASSS